MEAMLLWVGRGAGVLGMLVCLWAIVGRLSGSYFAGGFQIGTLLQAGMAALLVSCVCFLWLLTSKTRT
jgi:hypothetical protein